ncbi:MAG TPA: ATP-binding protein, partial [Gemmatimonadales bacterium]|nr:ATP-binding protein [Gemmatimonadales bacterium]
TDRGAYDCILLDYYLPGENGLALIAELRVEADRFRTLANAIPQLAWMADAAGHPYWFNQRWFDYTGDAGERPGDWRRFHHPDHIGRVEQGLRAIAETGIPWEDTHPLRGRDGTYRWYLSRALPMGGAGGEVSGVLGTCTDITERIQAEEMRVQAQKLAGVRMVAGGVAHEINNAMTVVLGFSQLLLVDPVLAEKSRDEIGLIQRAADRAAEVARQLLTYSRQVASNPRAIELDAALSDMAARIQPLLGGGRQFVTSWSCRERIWLDVNHLEQMMTILVLNARDAMPTGGTLTLSTAAVVLGPGVRDAVTGGFVPPGRYGQLVLRDTGVGMDAETLSHIFEPFFTTKPVGSGIGLGLPVLGGLLEEYGGYVTVASEPDLGTSFTLYLPLLTGDVAEQDAPVPGSLAGEN